MRLFSIGVWTASVAFLCLATAQAEKRPSTNAPARGLETHTQTWNQAAAAKYLDDRELWWQEWPRAQKDHGTICVSCHTQVPYALARPLLRAPLSEQQLSGPERIMLDSVLKRVNLGNQAETFYSDAVHGPGKTREARNAESVNNALILAAYDAANSSAANAKTDPALHTASRKALAAMWALQEQSGPKAGAWLWQNFYFSPWEAPESEYYGAAMAALASGIAPGNYRDDPAIQPNLTLLRNYLKHQAPTQPLINHIALLWASSRLPGLMTDAERTALAAEIAAKQHADGGWSLTELGEGTWERHDNTPFDLRSDGYATGIIVLALEDNKITQGNTALKRGLAWLLANQSNADGHWQAWSLNLKRDPESGVGKFMSDAATAFAVLALQHSHPAENIAAGSTPGAVQ